MIDLAPQCPYPFLPSRIRVKERLSRDEPSQRSADWSPDRHQVHRHRAQANAQHPAQHSDRTVLQPQPSPAHHPAHATYPPPSGLEYQYPGPAVDAQPYLAIPAPAAASSSAKPGPPEVHPRRRVSADQIYASHREARQEARQALKEEAHTEGLLKSRKAVLPSEIRRREKSVDDTQRGRHDDAEWQNLSPEWRRRRSRGEEDWDRDRPRERGRERTVERIRERGREHVSSHDGPEERVFRSLQPPQPSGPRHQASEPVYVYQEPGTQQAYDPAKRQHAAQIQQPDPVRPHQREHSRPPQEPVRHQRLQDYEPHRHELQDVPRKQRDPQPDQDPEPPRPHQEPHRPHQEPPRPHQEPHRPHQDPSGQQRFDSAVYLHKDSSSSVPQAKHRSLEAGGGPKPKIRTRSMSDIGVSQHSAMYRERAAATRETLRAAPPPAMANGDVGTLDTRVSVAQLRHSYLENANRKPEL